CARSPAAAAAPKARGPGRFWPASCARPNNKGGRYWRPSKRYCVPRGPARILPCSRIFCRPTHRETSRDGKQLPYRPKISRSVPLIGSPLSDLPLIGSKDKQECPPYRILIGSKDKQECPPYRIPR